MEITPIPVEAPISYQTSYLRKALDPLQRKLAVDGLIKLITGTHVDFDVIVCHGCSGLLIAPIVAHELDKPIVVVRKGRDSSHSDYGVEGIFNFKSYIIIDDFVETGTTVDRVIRKIHRSQVCWKDKPEFRGIYCYYDMEYRSTSRYSEVLKRMYEVQYLDWKKLDCESFKRN